METQRNKSLEALVWITGILLTGGAIFFVGVSMIVGIVMLVLGAAMGVVTLVTKAVVSGGRG